jgi:hypothetical protein
LAKAQQGRQSAKQLDSNVTFEDVGDPDLVDQGAQDGPLRRPRSRWSPGQP